ncbi:MAG: glycosyl transferase [Halioglobus sp.]|nr:glycosyl transferase [Halioglobus sp.]
MAPQVSFIIPALNEAAGIAPLLEDLRRRYPGWETVVVDGGSGDDTVRRAMPRCDQLLLAPPGRARQMNLGAAVARGDYLCFLHADSRPGVAAAQLASYLRREPDWGFCQLRLDGTRRVYRVIEWCINWRSRLTAIGTGDQMLFLRREVFERSGGFDRLPLMEDVAYCKRLRRLGPPLVLPEPVTTSSRRWEEGGVARTVLRMWCLRLAYWLGVSPARLARHYTRRAAA